MILAARRRYLRAVNPMLSERRRICSLLNQVRPRLPCPPCYRAFQSAPLHLPATRVAAGRSLTLPARKWRPAWCCTEC